MSSKSPVRSCEDVDETSLSYAEIKALCAGNPLIKERMDLDVDVARLRLLKADYQSQHYSLEDNLLKYYPESIEKAKGQISGFESDIGRLARCTPKIPAITAETSAPETPEAGEKPKAAEAFPPMEIGGVVYSDKGEAGAALLEACKKFKSADQEKIGSYRGFDMNLSFDTFYKKFHLTLKGSMSYGADLSADAYGNITRINNALADMPTWLQSVQAHLENLCRQVENAKEEVKKPFPQEQELTEKTARLALIDAELNMDGRQTAEPAVPEQDEAIAKSKPSILDNLRKPEPFTPRPADKQDKNRNSDMCM